MKRIELLARPGLQPHLVQFYAEETVLARNVALFLKEGAERGERSLVISTPAHTKLFREQLRASGTPTEPLEQDRRLQFLDAQETLESILVDDEPDWVRFDTKIGGLVREAKKEPGTSGLRGFGEMVDLLWRRGRLGAATRLEGFWNRLLRTDPLALFCAYTVDLLSPATKSGELQELISLHSHVLPSGSNGELEAAVNRAMNEVLGSSAVEALLPLIRANVVSRILLPEAERMVLWLQRNLPPIAERVLNRARSYYQVECAQSIHARET